MSMGSDPQAVRIRPWSSNGWASAILALLLFQVLFPATAGVLYTERELWAVGNLWEQTRAEWHSELERYNGRVAEIEASAIPQRHQEFLIRKEASYHRAESQRLAGKRDQVQQVLIHESNARAAGSGHATRERIKATLGTPVTDPGHRGIRGDLDAGGGEIVARHMQDVLKEMGLGHLPVRDSPGTLDIGGEFELCIHKGGLAPAAGSEYHHIRNNVDARNHEVYMSERMRNRAAGTKQAGTDFVEVQDHLKKASDGLFSSDAELVQHADRMQIMAKGTNKTLQMGDVSDQELAAILQQHGVTDTPEQFRRKMSGIKEERVVISDPAEAGKLRDISRDVFATAESRTYARAQTELDTKLAEANRVREQVRRVDAMSDRPETRARREALKKSLQTRERLIREEIVDSRSKMMATANANAETRARATRSTSPETTRARPADPGARVTGPETPAADRLRAGASKAYAAFTLATDIVDVVNTVRAFDEYMAGEAPLSQVVRNALNVPPLSPIGTVLGTSERIGASTVDYLRASADLRRANEDNLAAYLTQWEIRFRRAGMSPTEARTAVADAVLAGDLDALEARAQALRRVGQEIESPVLVVEEGVGPDGGAWYMWENTKDMGYGMAYGIADATHYLANIPVRMATAWDHSDLEYDDTIAETEAQTQLFRALLNAGIDREQALIAVQAGGATLHRTARQARENLEAAREEQSRIEDERRRLEQRIDSILARIDILRWMNLSLRTEPASPIALPRDTPDDFVVEVELALTGDFNQTINGIRHDLGNLTSQEPTVVATYRISLPGAEEVEPGVWRAQLPAVPDFYPVTVEAEVTLSGFGDEYAGLKRTVYRTVADAVLIRTAQESIAFEQDRFTFRDGDYEPIRAVVEAADPEATYYFFWTFGDRTAITETPEWWFHAVLDEPGRDQSGEMTVALADLSNGGLLDEAHAAVHIEPHGGAVLLLNTSAGMVRQSYQCSEIVHMNFATPRWQELHREAQSLKAQGYVEGDQIQGVGPPGYKDRQQRYHCMPDGRFVRYGDRGEVDVDAVVAGILSRHGLGEGVEEFRDRIEALWGGQIGGSDADEQGRLARIHAEVMAALNYSSETGSYRAGRKHGLWEQWLLVDGGLQIQRRTPWVDGEKHGLETVYSGDRVWGHLHWANDKRHGPTTYYSRRVPGGISESYTFEHDTPRVHFRWEEQRVRWARTGIEETTGWIKLDADKAVIERYDADFNLLRREEMK